MHTITPRKLTSQTDVANRVPFPAPFKLCQPHWLTTVNWSEDQNLGGGAGVGGGAGAEKPVGQGDVVVGAAHELRLSLQLRREPGPVVAVRDAAVGDGSRAHRAGRRYRSCADGAVVGGVGLQANADESANRLCESRCDAVGALECAEAHVAWYLCRLWRRDGAGQLLRSRRIRQGPERHEQKKRNH